MQTRHGSKAGSNFPTIRSPTTAVGNVKIVATNKVLMPINPLFEEVKFEGTVKLKAIERNYAERLKHDDFMNSKCKYINRLKMRQVVSKSALKIVRRKAREPQRTIEEHSLNVIQQRGRREGIDTQEE